MKPNGIIICHTRPIGLRARPFEWLEWQGGDVIAISYDLPQDAYDGILSTRDPQPGATFWLGPFLLRCLAYDFSCNRIIACRERPVKAQIYALLYRATRTLDWLYRRMVLTLAVWGMARYSPATVPSWRDVKGTRRLAAWADARQAKQRAAIIERINRSLADDTTRRDR